MRIEQQILSNLIHNEHYCRKVIPFLKREYFSDRKEPVIVNEIVQDRKSTRLNSSHRL